jgi:hypothetical protein
MDDDKAGSVYESTAAGNTCATALEKIVETRGVYQYILAVTILLEYMAIILSEHNLYILHVSCLMVRKCRR